MTTLLDVRTCEVCGRELPAGARAHRRTCGAACRQALARGQARPPDSGTSVVTLSQARGARAYVGERGRRWQCYLAIDGGRERQWTGPTFPLDRRGGREARAYCDQLNDEAVPGEAQGWVSTPDAAREASAADPVDGASSTTGQSLSERLWAKVDRAGGAGSCWPWMGARVGKGYGHLAVVGRGMVKAHRLVLEEKLGRPLAPGMFACHSCDNPPCCNPDHLFEASASDNARDMVAKGRAPDHMRPRETCHRGHPLTPDNTVTRADGERRCRTCKNATNQAYRDRSEAPRRAPVIPAVDSGLFGDASHVEPDRTLYGVPRPEGRRSRDPGEATNPETVASPNPSRDPDPCRALQLAGTRARRGEGLDRAPHSSPVSASSAPGSGAQPSLGLVAGG